MNHIVGKLSYSNVISTLCLVLLLGGGTAYAATHMLPKNSVGTKQIRNGAITPAKLSKAADSALSGPAGPSGATGPQGPKGEQGPPGDDGTDGRNLTAETALASGQTETGDFAVGGANSGDLIATAVFVQPLPARLDAGHAIYLKAGVTSAPHCPGRGRADPGYFCAYAVEEANVEPQAPEDPADGAYGAGRDGVQVFFHLSGTGGSYVYGSWAVTSP